MVLPSLSSIVLPTWNPVAIRCIHLTLRYNAHLPCEIAFSLADNYSLVTSTAPHITSSRLIALHDNTPLELKATRRDFLSADVECFIIRNANIHKYLSVSLLGSMYQDYT